jgi:hypothetical protein
VTAETLWLVCRRRIRHTPHTVVFTAFLNGYAASVYGAYANANRQAGVQATIGAVNRASSANTAPDWRWACKLQP